MVKPIRVLKSDLLNLFKTVFLFLLISFHFSTLFSQKPDWAGVWGIWGGENYSRIEYPWYRGTGLDAMWSTIHPERYRFNFSALDEQIRIATENGLYITFKIYIAPGCAPEWLYDEVGVERVVAPPPPWAKDGVHPWYFDQRFEPEFKRMIQAVADHIESYSEEMRKSIIGVQAVLAKSGDPQPYSGTPFNPKYYIPSHNPSLWWADTAWQQYNQRMYTFFYDIYKDKKPEILLIIKPTDNNEDWAFYNLPRAGRKTFSVAQGYHLADEAKLLFQQKNMMKGMPLLRGEFDLGIRDNTAWYLAAPVWNVYWTSLWCLNINLDIWNQRTQMMDNPHDHIKAFEFFSKWAGYKWPENSPGGWIAFRDDIDCADIDRFPEEIYGEFIAPDRDNNTNLERFNAIADEFSPYGARQDDPESAGLEALNVVRKQKGLNDIQWNVWRGNYGMHITQKYPNQTSQGYWRIGPKDQPYGRFARGFNSSEGKNGIYLDVNDSLAANVGFFESPDTNIRIVYYDEGFGKWEIRYNSTGNSNKRALKVKNSNSGHWKEITINVNDIVFNNRGPYESDLSIVNLDKKDNIFHMVEVKRSMPESE